MNKQRKQIIRTIRYDLSQCKERLQKVLDDEQSSFDNMPDNLQGSLRGSESEDAIDIMEECIEGLEKIIDELGNII